MFMAECEFPGSLVSVEWLHQHLGDEGVLVLDASWHLPGKDRCGREEWQGCHIPGAHFLTTIVRSKISKRICHACCRVRICLPNQCVSWE